MKRGWDVSEIHGREKKSNGGRNVERDRCLLTANV